jgi:Tol biopolymer transport system component
MGLLCAFVLSLGGTEIPGFSCRLYAAADDSSAWPAGRWRVIERCWELDTPLTRLEIRRSSASDDAIVVAFETDDRGQPRVWGSGRLDRQVVTAESARWLTAEWTAGSTVVLLQLRLERKDRLCAVVRQRERQSPAVTADRVRQVILEPEPSESTNGATRPVPGPIPSRRPPSGSSDTSKVELVGLFRALSDGSGLRPIAQPEGFSQAAHPAWSRDGRWIAFTAFDASGRDPLIRIVSAEGGPTTAVAAGISPSWSHDGRRIAYVASGRPEFATDWISPGRNDERIEALRLTGPGAGEIEVLARGLWPRWSPSDNRLLFVARRDANWDVFLRSPDGLRLLRLTDDPALDTRPVWYADGRSAMFLSDRGNRWDLYRVSTEGQNELVRLTNQRRREEAADLAPSGEHVLFTDTPSRGQSQIMRLELSSGLVRPLLDPPNGDRDPAWSPDGRSIAFVSRRPGAMVAPRSQ